MEEKTSYDVANQFCKNQGARLFEPKSEATNKLVFDKAAEVFEGEHRSWIGINDMDDEGEFVFTSSGKKVSSFFWHPYNVLRSTEDCVLMGWPSQQWEWSDRPCSENWYSICEFDNGHRRPRGERRWGRPGRRRIH